MFHRTERVQSHNTARFAEPFVSLPASLLHLLAINGPIYRTPCLRSEPGAEHRKGELTPEWRSLFFSRIVKGSTSSMCRGLWCRIRERNGPPADTCRPRRVYRGTSMNAREQRAATAQASTGPPASLSPGFVKKTAGVCGGEACIRDTRVTVWGLVERRRLGLTDEEIIDRLPALTPADLALAWDYYDANRDEIDRVIRQNENA